MSLWNDVKCEAFQSIDTIGEHVKSGTGLFLVIEEDIFIFEMQLVEGLPPDLLAGQTPASAGVLYFKAICQMLMDFKT